ncbi:MAG: hypothetical protein MRY32_04945 [Rickettsiales bacterium]|nr:hypothetical protein [Rickettsiales bacterium]
MRRWLRSQWLYILTPLLLWGLFHVLGFTSPEKQETPQIIESESTPTQEVVDTPYEHNFGDQQDTIPTIGPDGFYTSDAGLRYGPDPNPKFASRIDHVMAHTLPDDTKPKHSIFVVKETSALLSLIDEAWKKRGPPKNQGGGGRGRDVYTINMGQIIGESGQTHIRIVTEADSENVITAYPVEVR